MKVFSLCVYVIKEKPLGLGRANKILRRRVEALATKQNALNINMLLSASLQWPIISMVIRENRVNPGTEFR